MGTAVLRMKYRKTAFYTGRRVVGQKVLQRFEFPDGREMFFKGVRQVWIGAAYRCGAKNISTRPERVYDVDPIHNPKWEAADAVAASFLSQKRAEKKLANNQTPMLDAAVEALLPLCREVSYFERKYLIEELLDRIERRLKKKPKC